MLGSEGVLSVWVAPAIVDYGAQVIMVMEVGVYLFSTASPTAAPAASHGALVPLLLLLLMVVLLMLLLLFLQ